ncbi:hypothetical protein THRCLA_01754 [Thraustotheca clavata]|uniref:Uncharacterized protein n=1 Tax=Thraustotheca clavata TaxID=74557 RepID=A0A1W0A7D4_9STRA|nr:hypothetical protein THRCLA_01754 [Thraustotheca clavata]
MEDTRLYKREAIGRKIVGLFALLACATTVPFKDDIAGKVAGAVACMVLYFSIMDLVVNVRIKRGAAMLGAFALSSAGLWFAMSPILDQCSRDTCACAYASIVFLFVTAFVQLLALRYASPLVTPSVEDDEFARKRAEIVLSFQLRLDLGFALLFTISAVIMSVLTSNATAFAVAAFLQVLQTTGTYVLLQNVRQNMSRIEATYVESV